MCVVVGGGVGSNGRWKGMREKRWDDGKEADVEKKAGFVWIYWTKVGCDDDDDNDGLLLTRGSE